MKKRVIYSCITLQKELENTIKKFGFKGKVNYLNVALHSDPQKMHETLQGIIDANTEAEEIIICVSAARLPAICTPQPALLLCHVLWTASMSF